MADEVDSSRAKIRLQLAQREVSLHVAFWSVFCSINITQRDINLRSEVRTVLHYYFGALLAGMCNGLQSCCTMHGTTRPRCLTWRHSWLIWSALPRSGAAYPMRLSRSDMSCTSWLLPMASPRKALDLSLPGTSTSSR